MDSVISNVYSDTSQLTHITKNTNYKDQESNAHFKISWNKTTKVHPFSTTAVKEDNNEMRKSNED